MRNETYVEDIAKFAGQDVTISGWLYNRRSSGKLHFIMVRDGTGTIQAVVSKAEVPEAVFALCDTIPQESSIKVIGKVAEDKRSPIGFEIQVKNVELVHQAEEYPITPKEHGIEFLMDNRHLWLRSSKQHATLRIRHAVIRACRDFFDG
ncbi:MAG TPA: OB-fold nucleic acid binding domain-containing protein, partial [bacterium]